MVSGSSFVMPPTLGTSGVGWATYVGWWVRALALRDRTPSFLRDPGRGSGSGLITEDLGHLVTRIFRVGVLPVARVPEEVAQRPSRRGRGGVRREVAERRIAVIW
ncbi:hypothetical protein ASG49_08405 [Marmoricola sp. Leaf446]|nr:hypothetical protein ASG49_08405 [Marmoricola sp. Leaf446]